MPNITEEIIMALNKAADAKGSDFEIAKMAGISHSTLSKYKSGAIKKINPATWAMIYPILKPYLPEDIVQEFDSVSLNKNLAIQPPKVSNTIQNTPELRLCIMEMMMEKGIKGAAELCRIAGYDKPSTMQRLLDGKINWFPDMLCAVLDNLGIKHDDAPMSSGERTLLTPDGMYYNDGSDQTRAVLVHYIPVIEWANAAEYIELLCKGDGKTMKQWDPDTKGDAVPLPIGMRQGTIAIRIAGASMEPTILDHDILYCEPVLNISDIADRKIVVISFSDGSKYDGCVFCKRFRRIGKAYFLTSDNPSGREFEIQSKDIASIWIVRKKMTDTL